METRQLDKLGQMLQTAVDSGANSIDNLVFSVEDDEVYCNELIEQATKKARQKAQTLAKALDVRIIGIKNATSSYDKFSARPFRAGAMMEKAAPTPPVEPGEIDINARVTVEFLIEN